MDALALTGAILEFGYGLLAFITGVFVLAIGPEKKANQALGALLIVDGVGMGGMLSQARNWEFFGPAFVNASVAASGFSFGMVPALYLLFIGAALQGPIAEFLGRPVVKALVTLGGLTSGVVLWQMMVLSQGGTWQSEILFAAPLISSGAIGLAATIQNLRHAVTEEDKRRAKAYLFAFVVRDASYVLFYTAMIVLVAAEVSGGLLLGFWLTGLQSLWLIFLAFLLYGILTGQIAGLDKKFRVGISSTASAAVIAVLFVVLTESIEGLFSSSNNAISIGIAVVLAFTFRPIQALAERGARRILPSRPVTAAGLALALEKAMADGVVTPREQRMLDDLQRRLEA